MSHHNFIWMAYLASALRYFLFAGLSYLLFYAWEKQKFLKFKIQAADPKKSVISTELKYSISTIFIFATVVLLVLRSPLTAYTQVYHNFNNHSVWYFLFSIPAAIFIHDTYFYWTHRLMHWKRIFPYVHHIHHKSHNPTPLAAFSFHPLEALIEIGVLPLIVFIMPIHPIALATFGTYMIVMNVIGHLGFELMPESFVQGKILRLLNTSTHHNMHHHYSKCNYGLYFSVWDRLMGTLHRQYETQFRNIARRARKTNQQVNQKLEIINS
ncbi:MAG TPA: sterol desaturase family protein [Mucilaginibacter sp.]|nr:sterol desaturase family protein [Mucilaginibacter sp.]